VLSKQTCSSILATKTCPTILAGHSAVILLVSQLGCRRWACGKEIVNCCPPSSLHVMYIRLCASVRQTRVLCWWRTSHLTSTSWSPLLSPSASWHDGTPTSVGRYVVTTHRPSPYMLQSAVLIIVFLFVQKHTHSLIPILYISIAITFPYHSNHIPIP